MRVLNRTAKAGVLGFSLLLGLTACGAVDSHPGQGMVTSLDVDARRVTLDHDDIPGFMKGMTMTFEVAPGVELDGIDRGVEVDFRVKEDRGIYTLTELRPVGL